MSQTRAGLLFALPQSTATARLLDGAGEWREPLEAAGVTIVDERTADLVVAPAERAEEVAASGAQTAILLGGDGKALKRAGWATRAFLPVPNVAEPSLLIPLDQPGAARYALANLSVPSSAVKRLRNHALGLALAARLPAAGVRVPGSVVLASRAPGPPFLVATGEQLGLAAGLDWFLVLGRAIERAAFFLFEPRARTPSFVLKFSPDHLNPEQFLEDERAHRQVAEAGGPLAERAPRLVGVSTDGPRPVTVETAASGAPMVYWLRTSGGRARKQALVEQVARWLIDVGRTTALPGRAADVARAFAYPEGIVEETGADVDALVAQLDGVHAVFEHRDLAPTHVLADGDAFTVIDWEEARREGLPLADLAFFLSAALTILDGELDDPAFGRREAFARLFRGDSPSGPLLFSLLREASAACDVPNEAVGPLLSLTWLRLAIGPRRHLAEVWFEDPLLGPGWEAWRRAS